MRFFAADKRLRMATVLAVAVALLLTLAVPNDPPWLHALKGTAFVVCALSLAWSSRHGKPPALTLWLAVGGIALGGVLALALIV